MKKNHYLENKSKWKLKVHLRKGIQKVYSIEFILAIFSESLQIKVHYMVVIPK